MLKLIKYHNLSRPSQMWICSNMVCLFLEMISEMISFRMEMVYHRDGHWGKSQGFMDKFLVDLKYLVLFLYLFIITIVI